MSHWSGWKLGLFALLLSIGSMSDSARSDVTFSHDVGTVGVAPPPVNGVFQLPDPADAFASGAFVRTAPGPNLGNILLVNSQVSFGLLPGDNVDAFHVELRPLDTSPSAGYFPAFIFSTDTTAVGAPGTAVNTQSPINSADLFESNGSAINVLSVNENQIGLAPRPTEDLDAVILTLLSSLTGTERVYFSLTPGSPTLAALGASPADILVTRVGGTPTLSISAQQLGLSADQDDVDALVMLDGIDADDDGTFTGPGDRLPLVLFSVSPNSVGLPGSGVANEALIDPPVGGDIYFSSTTGFNTLTRDDAVLGLADDDNLDALSMPELGTPGLAPFTGGFSTPGGGGAGGGAGGVRISVCTSGLHAIWKGTVKVRIACGTGAVQPVGPVCFTIFCDDADRTLANIMLALQGLKVPGTGIPIFASAWNRTRLGPRHSQGTISVSPGLGALGCSLVNVSIRFCPCITVSLAIVSQVPIPMMNGGSVVMNPMRPIIDPAYSATFLGGASSGEFFFHRDPSGSDPALYLGYSAGSVDEALGQLYETFVDLGYDCSLDDSMLNLYSDPIGKPIEDYYATGVLGDPEVVEMEVGHTVERECPADLDGDGVVTIIDLQLIVQCYMGQDDDRVASADVDGDGELTIADVQLVATALHEGCDAIY